MSKRQGRHRKEKTNKVFGVFRRLENIKRFFSIKIEKCKDIQIEKKRRYIPSGCKKHHYKIPGLLAKLEGWISRSKKEDVLHNEKRWAENKGRGKHRIGMYAGTGAVVIAIIFTVQLVTADIYSYSLGSEETVTSGFGVEEQIAVPILQQSMGNSNAAAIYAALPDTITSQYSIEIEQVEETSKPSVIPKILPDTKAEVLIAVPPSEISKQISAQTIEPTSKSVPKSIPTSESILESTSKPIDMNMLIATFKVEADEYYNEAGFSSNYYQYTKKEMYMLAQLIHGEARGEPEKGKIAVGNVVMNRVLSRGYPGNDIAEVITARGQFSGYASYIKPSAACKEAARKVLDDQVWVIPQHTYFFNSCMPAGVNWSRHAFYTRIGGHNFYIDTHYTGRNESRKIPPALFERTYKWPQYGCKPDGRVEQIQLMLKKLGWDVATDAYFGIDTREALKEFQTQNGLWPDGIAGPSTIEVLILAYGEEAYIDEFYLES